MAKLDDDVELILERLLKLVVPVGMGTRERRQLAKKAGISDETLRAGIRNRSLRSDTLIRLLVARGVSPKTLASLSQSDAGQLNRGDFVWLEYGNHLTEQEKVEFVSLIRFMKDKWELSGG
ncbi:MAG: hypothetical protein JST16_03730 [Bdellovibrionales bacterium]|nr:hypothetical protein [Bdellovibrionales bacterium]